jgi:exopolyphosphatase/guanosine-5'-triphosphate,3'-diphosphate pyrophosphatase
MLAPAPTIAGTILTMIRDTQTALPTAKRSNNGSKKPDLLAAIDMGSNSFRLELAEISQGRYKRVDYLKQTVRLGAGLDAEGMLTEEAAQRGLTCLATFARRLKDFDACQVRAVATQTLREARNRDAFLLRANEALGFPIEVISGREEARLIYQGVARLQPSEVPRLVVDIGGRSTEMILGKGRTSTKTESFRIGSVSLSMKHFGDGRFTEEAFRAAQIEAGAELEEALQPFARHHWREALGSSGTVGAISQILQASGVTDGSITPEALRWCIAQCIQAGSLDALSLPGLKPERKAVLGGGLSILYTLAMHFDIEVMRPAKGALRQGVIFDLEDRLEAARNHRQTDPREVSAREMQQRFHVDMVQADRVRKKSANLWQSLHEGRAIKAAAAHEEATRELGWASSLHEIGMMLSHHDHHRHSAYLLGHVDAAGFSQSQLRHLSTLVLGQRGELSKLASHVGNRVLMNQVLCLRLAAILHHARMDLPARSVKLVQGRGRAELQLKASWAHQHPRTLHLLQEESEKWAHQGDRALVIQLVD